MSPLGFSLFRKGKLSETQPRPTVPSSGYHLITLDSYSDTKRIPSGESIDSAPFTIGGYRWVFNGCTVLAFDRLIGRRDFEKEHLNGDLSIIRCDINVAADSSVAAPLLENVPPSDIKEHIARLLSSKEGADVTFEAELFGPMKEGATANVIRIQDMEAKVFRALLSFIYTDSLPKMDIDSMDEGEVEEQGKGEEAMWLQSLLAAADRYDIGRMKLLCQNKLRECIDVGTVADILGLADQHYCPALKEACLEFLKIPRNLEKVLMVDGLDHIVQTCPSLVKELLSKFAS
ncbi:BTB/POZ and MATH domain-containing protein 2-like [Triticum dicoccoides]|uniref:BTB/POZ and MATH domain-containing protein 2-like n=1 Tax=Triticum dicoccoides TaxID=85692 RepID=UPI00188DFFE0|nr:BTB/POZ and MATH domain-containing protein 2-like [Triticum dicoccoides]